MCDINDEKRVSKILGSDEFDIIIDDGSHRYNDVIGGFRFLFSRLVPGGLYIVEDLHTSYWADYGGRLSKPSPSIEWFKNLIDAVNADHLELGGDFSEQALTELRAYGRWIARITFYDSVVVVEKLDAEKGSPYRRILSGAEDHVVCALDLIAGSSSSRASPTQQVIALAHVRTAFPFNFLYHNVSTLYFLRPLSKTSPVTLHTALSITSRGASRFATRFMNFTENGLAAEFEAKAILVKFNGSSWNRVGDFRG